MKKCGLVIFAFLILPSLSYSGDKIWKKFTIELSGGISTMNPTDLNLHAERSQKIEKFYNDDFFDYRLSQNSSFAYTKTTHSDFPKIKSAYLLGFRFIYKINERFGISFGLKGLSREFSHDVTNAWTFPYDYGNYQFRTAYSPYILSVRGYIPAIGIHFQKAIKGKLSIGGFLETGPLYGKCSIGYDYTEEWYSDEGNLIHRSSNEFLEETGEGNGYSLEAGLRISIAVGKFIPFFEGSYAFQKIKDLSGPGTERIAFLEETWEGEWGIKQYTLSREWGELTYEYPSNYWEEGALTKHRDFSLDLSGFQLRLGIAYRF
ncbi:MAG: hypothetical protein PVI66_14760 [Candidatus Aminicenantes bacterium]